VYRNAFARHDVERIKNKAVQSYADFAKDKTTKVNAKALYPYEVVAKAYTLTRTNGWLSRTRQVALDDTERLMINKYWDNLAEYISKLDLNALCVVDTSGSMWGDQASAPINIAISLGMIAADKARGPFHGQYISFSSRPQLIKVEGVDFVDKVRRIYQTNLCENTNLEATFDMLLNVAIRNHVKQSDLPKSIIVISDMQIDSQYGWGHHSDAKAQTRTMMENMRRKWKRAGYNLPKMIYWCVDSRRDTFLDDGPDVTYVSGSSAVLFEQIAKGVTAQDLMYEKLDSKRYAMIQ
jgi:NAD(P)-dependent dehydrogenase (short-subunit alcohol dehydrogenase family)